jgi:integrase
MEKDPSSAPPDPVIPKDTLGALEFSTSEDLPAGGSASQVGTGSHPTWTSGPGDLVAAFSISEGSGIKRRKPAKKGWAHNGFEKTAVQYLYRRNGKRGVVYYGRIRRGDRLYMERLGPDFEEAKRALRTWVGGAETKAAEAEAKPEGTKLVTWGDFKAKFLRRLELDITMAPKSISYQQESAARIVRVWKETFKDDLESQKVRLFTQEQWQVWANSACAYHIATYNNMRGTLFRIFQLALDAGAITANPACLVKRLGKRMLRVTAQIADEAGQPGAREETDPAFPSDVGERWYPEPKQLRAITAKMRSYKFGRTQRAADFTELLAYTGCRLSEGRRLRWQDVDWRQHTLRINGAKGRMTSMESSIRYVPIFPALEQFLKRLERQRPDKLPTSPIALVRESRGTMQRACLELGMPRKLDHHDLRHYFASRAVNSGRPIPIVADWLGHKDGGALLLRVYRHRNQQLSQKWAKGLAL